MDYVKVTTSAEVYAVLFARHRDELVPFGSFSDPDGTFNGRDGTEGCMETEYGFAGTPHPIIAIRTTWNISRDEKRETGKRLYQYWLCIGKESA